MIKYQPIDQHKNKIVGYKLYQKNRGDIEKINVFYKFIIKGKYKNNLIILDNALKN